LKLSPVGIAADGPRLRPGDLLVDKRRVLAGTATEPVELSEVRAAGKKPMSAIDWARGMRVSAEERFE
jgi:methionyl-tRNA formyltransferase